MTAIIFDFDLTLADSTAGAVECVDHAFRKMGLDAASPSAIRQTVGLITAQNISDTDWTIRSGGGDDFLELVR